MSYRLVILGVLAEKPHYGYDLKQTIERQHYAEYIRLSGGGLYYHLRKLQEEGYIEEQMVEREGKYPDRHIYQITERGRSYLIELLRSTLDDVEGRRVYDSLDAALSFAFLLPDAEIMARLQHQLDVFQGQFTALEMLQSQYLEAIKQPLEKINSAVKREIFYKQLIVGHKIALWQHEGRWLQEAVRRIGEQHDHATDEQSCEHHTEADTADSRQVIRDVYAQMQRLRPVIGEALAEYNRQLDRAWQEYQRQLTTRHESELGQARQVYQQRITEIKQAHEQKLGCMLAQEEGEQHS